MPSMAEKFWEMGRSPPQQMMFILFGLAALLTAVITRGMFVVVGAGAAVAPTIIGLTFVAAVLGGVGAFFVTLGLFLGAYASNDQGVAWKIAQLVGAVIVLIILL